MMGEDIQEEDEGFGGEDIILGEEHIRKEEAARLSKIAEEIDAKCRQVHDPEEGTINFGKMRATDAKGNTRVILPKPGSVKFEMELEAKRM